MTVIFVAPSTAASARTRSGQPDGRPLRVALYSHDAQGLGHIRRNLAVAQALSRLAPRPDVLLLSGAPEAGALARPAGCDVVTLPAVEKQPDGAYQARHLSTSLDELAGLRTEVLTAALRAFAPDVLVVDKHPRGFHGELEPALDLLAGQTRIVLGLRDVLDDAQATRVEWAGDKASPALSRWYDAVWVYGDPAVHDLLAQVDLPRRLRRCAAYTGYLGHGRPAGEQALRLVPSRPYVVGLLGGGQDGEDLAAAFVRAPLPDGADGVLVLGPHLPDGVRDRVRRLARGRPDLRLIDFVDDPGPLLDAAAAAVSMGGYNAVCELMSRGLPTLVVPRVQPRREQLVRAEGLERLGVVDVLHPDRLAPDRLGSWLQQAVHRERRVPQSVDLGGLDRIPRLVAGLAAGVPAPVLARQALAATGTGQEAAAEEARDVAV